MASNPIGREAQPVTLPGTIPPMPAVARILSRYDRGKLAAFVTVAIDLLDVMDGDPDAETGEGAEDDFVLPPSNVEFATNCPATDSIEHDAGSYAEWHTLRAAERRNGTCMADPCGNEDDELAGDETDGNGAEDEDVAWFRNMKAGPGCTVSDPDRDDDGY